MVEPTEQNNEVRRCLLLAAGNLLSTWAMFESSRTQRPYDEFMSQAEHLMADFDKTADSFITEINPDPIFESLAFCITAMDQAFGMPDVADAFAATTQQLAAAVVDFNGRP